MKALNDTHGHAAGDEALEHVAATLRQVVRAGDHAFRIGGDEFAVILPEAGADDAGAVAARIEEELANFASAGTWKLSMSFGISVHNAEDDPAVLLRSADDAMYDMKHRRETLGLDAVA